MACLWGDAKVKEVIAVGGPGLHQIRLSYMYFRGNCPGSSCSVMIRTPSCMSPEPNDRKLRGNPSVNSGGMAARMGLVRRTALPPCPVVIGLEKAAVGSPRNQAHDGAARYHH